MKKRRIIWSALVLVGLIATVVFWLGRPENFATYQGKDAWQWSLQLLEPGAGKRAEAAAALKKMGPDALPLLRLKLGAKPSWDRRIRIWIGEKLSPATKQKLTKDLKPISFESIRSTAAIGLAALGTNAAPAIPELIKAVKGDNLQITWEAATALGSIGEPAVSELVLLLDDSRPKVRQATVFALGQVTPPAVSAVPALIRRLEDRDPVIRALTLDMLKQIGPIAGPAVLKYLEESRGQNRRLAAAAVAAVGPRGTLALPYLLEMMQDEDAENRAVALDAMAALRITRTNALEVYRSALTDTNVPVRTAAARAMGNLYWKMQADLPALEVLRTNDSAESVRLAAQKAVENILSFATNGAVKESPAPSNPK